MRNLFVLCMLMLVCNGMALVEENASLYGFLYGSAPTCAYDNWMSHTVEGLARPGYNYYPPWDVQTNGFGQYHFPTTQELAAWQQVVAAFYNQDYAMADSLILTGNFPYQTVHFTDTDTGRSLYMLREVLDNQYIDNNGTPDYPGDDTTGSFNYGWGLFIFDPSSQNPLLYNVVHPNDDFIAIPIIAQCFMNQNARYLLLFGTGREAAFTGMGYTNTVSAVDPSRISTHPFNTAYRAACDNIRSALGQREFSLQLHSYDWTAHSGHASCQMSAGNYQTSPDLPLRDFSSHGYDVVHTTPWQVLAPAAVGDNAEVNVTDYYSIFYSEYPFVYTHDGQDYDISDENDVPGYSNNVQQVYTQQGQNPYDVQEHFMHVEFDELPNCYVQDLAHFYAFYGYNSGTQQWTNSDLYIKTLQYYGPFITSMTSSMAHYLEMNDHNTVTTPQSVSFAGSSLNSVTVSWRAVDSYDFSNYELLYSSSPITDDNYQVWDAGTQPNLACAATTSGTITGLTGESNYYVAVRSRDKNDNVSNRSTSVLCSTGTASIINFVAIGRDAVVNISWTAQAQHNNAGFYIYKRVGTGAYSLVSSWHSNTALTGSNSPGVNYNVVDTDVQNGTVYNYRLIAESTSGSFFTYGVQPNAYPMPIYILRFRKANATTADSLAFGMNPDASDDFDTNYDTRATDYPSGNYFYTQFYEEEFDTGYQWLSRDICDTFDPNSVVKTWNLIFRTNQINIPVTVRLVNPPTGNGQFWLVHNGVYTNLSTDTYTFTPTVGTAIPMVLYWGTLKPTVNFATVDSRILQPGTVLPVAWNTVHSPTIDHYLLEYGLGSNMVTLQDNLPNTTTSWDWTIPDTPLEGVRFKLTSYLASGDTIQVWSGYRIGVTHNSFDFSYPAGWHTGYYPDLSGRYTSTQLYGTGSILLQYNEGNFVQYSTLTPNKGYWVNPSAAGSQPITQAILADGTVTIPLQVGWNLVPNPHVCSHPVSGITLLIGEQELTWVAAGGMQLCEPFFYEYHDNAFTKVTELAPQKSYYVYCYRENVSLVFHPYAPQQTMDAFSIALPFRLSATVNGVTDTVTAGVQEHVNDGFDFGYDAQKPAPVPFPKDFDLYIPMTVDDVILHLGTSAIPTSTARYYSWPVTLVLNTDAEVTLRTMGTMSSSYHMYLDTPQGVLRMGNNVSASLNLAAGEHQFTLIFTTQTVAADDPTNIVPAVTKLEGSYPNPFNPSTTLRYNLAKAGRVNLTVYNVRGQKVRTLVDESKTPGTYQVVFNGRSDTGQSLSSGVYFIRLEAGGKSQTQKAIMLK